MLDRNNRWNERLNHYNSNQLRPFKERINMLSTETFNLLHIHILDSS